MAEPGWKVCKYHGAYGGNPHIKELNEIRKPIQRELMKNNTLGALHGALAKKHLLTPEEFGIYDEIKERLRSDYDLDDAADEILLHMLAMAAAKLFTSQRFGVMEGVRRYTREINDHLGNLGIQRRERLRLEKTTGQEDAQGWALGLMDRISRVAGALPPPRHQRIIDVEPSEGTATAITIGSEGVGSVVPEDRALEVKIEGEE